jgi:hypothetical protein
LSQIESKDAPIPRIQGCWYLRRRSSAYARDENCLKEHLHLQQCYYNFIRPHFSLKYLGHQTTPAMAAKIVSRRIDFRTIFSAGRYFFILNILCTVKQMRSSATFLTPISKFEAKQIELFPKYNYENSELKLAV